MKQFLLILFTFTLCSAPGHAQFSGPGNLFKGVKTLNDARKARKKALEAWGNTKLKDISKYVKTGSSIDESKKTTEKIQQQMYENNLELKKIMEIYDDTTALRKYYEERFGGLSQEEMFKKIIEDAGMRYDSTLIQESYANILKMNNFQNDSVFIKILTEQRQPTMSEASYLNAKYNTNFEYEGMEAYNDSIGVFGNINGVMKPMSISKCEYITDEKPVLDIGQDAIKQYARDYITFLKKPLADRVVIDSLQNYMIYKNRHAAVQFNGKAIFTLYSNLYTDLSECMVNDMLLRNFHEFTTPIDPKNIFVFKVHKGIGCRYMEYMYSKLSYKESELWDYINNRLVDEGYIDANINQKISDEMLFNAIVKMEFQFKTDKLLKIRQNKEKFIYCNKIPAARNVIISSKTRKVGGHVTALDITIDAEPGEYAFIIRNPDVEQTFKQENLDISILTEGAFFFSIK